MIRPFSALDTDAKIRPPQPKAADEWSFVFIGCISETNHKGRIACRRLGLQGSFRLLRGGACGDAKGVLNIKCSCEFSTDNHNHNHNHTHRLHVSPEALAPLSANS